MTRGLFLVLLVPLGALAAFPVEWDTPTSCAPPAFLPAGEGRAEVIVRERAGTWSVTVLFFEPTAGLRRVNATSCEEALHAAQLLIELGAQNDSPPPLPPQPVAQASPAPEVPEQPRVSLGLGAVADFGSFPLAEPRAVVSAALAFGAFKLALDGRFGFPLSLSPRAQVHRAFELQLAGCAQARADRWAGGPCVAFSAGSWRAQSSSGAAETFVVASAAQLRGSVRLVAGLELGALAGLRFNLRRPAPFDADGEVFTTPLLASELQLTLGWRW